MAAPHAKRGDIIVVTIAPDADRLALVLDTDDGMTLRVLVFETHSVYSVTTGQWEFLHRKPGWPWRWETYSG